MAEIQSSPQEHTYKFDIQMNCGGCSGAIDRVLKKLDGISSYSVSLEQQSAEVHTSSVDFATVLEKIKKTGKTVKGAEADGVKQDV